MIKIKDIVTEKRTGFKGEVVNIRRKGCKTLFVVDFHLGASDGKPRATRSFTRNEIATELATAVSNLANLCKHIDEGKRPLPCSPSQTHFGFHSR